MAEQLNKRTLELEEKKSDQGKGGQGKGGNGRKGNGKRGKWYADGKQTNDKSWHLKNVQMLKDLFTIAFNKLAGFPVWLKSNLKEVPINIGYIRTFYVDWFAGLSKDFRSMLNTAATNIWEFIRSRNAGAVNYGSSDIFINVIFGCLDIMATSVYLTLPFKIAKMFKVQNRLLPKKIFEGMKIDYEDFNSNISIYRGRYNLLLAKASAIVVPKQFPLYDWVMSLFQYIYKDRDTDTGREQLYVHVKEAYHIYDPTSRPTGGAIRLMNMKDLDPSYPDGAIVFGPQSEPVKFSVLLDIWEAQINAIITDEDTNIIFGDLIKAYGSEGKFWNTTPLTEEDSIQLTYSKEYLMQLHNAIIVPAQPDTLYTIHPTTKLRYGNKAYLNDVYQDTSGYLNSQYWKSYEGDLALLTEQGYRWFDDEMEYLLDSNETHPTPEEVCLMTRYHNRMKWNNSAKRLEATACSAIIFSEGEIIAILEGDLTNVRTSQMLVAPNSNGNFSRREVFDMVGINSNFDWTPIVYVGQFTEGDTQINHVRIFADLNNIVNISKATVERMHEVDFASLLDIPFTGKF